MLKNSIWEKWIQPSLKENPDPNALRFFPAVNQTMSLLQFAVIVGTLDDVKKLVTEYGADVNAKGDLQQSRALHAAVSIEAKDMVAFLIEQGANVHVKNKEEVLPASYAVIAKNSDLLALLLDHAELTPQDSLNLTGLAIVFKCLPCFSEIMKRCADSWQQENLNKSFIKAAILNGILSGDPVLQKGLLPVYANHQPMDEFPSAKELISMAALLGQKYVISTLMEQGYDITDTNNNGSNALMLAASRPSNSAMVKFLLEKTNIDPLKVDAEGHNALDYAHYYFVEGKTLPLLENAGLTPHNGTWSATPNDVAFTSIAAFENNRMLTFDPATHSATYLSLSPFCNYHGIGTSVVRDEAHELTFIICKTLPGSSNDIAQAVVTNQRPGEGYYIPAVAQCSYHGISQIRADLGEGKFTAICQHTRGHLPLEGKIVDGKKENFFMLADASQWLNDHPNFFVTTNLYECEGRGFTYGHVYATEYNEEYDILDLVDAWICQDSEYGRIPHDEL